jgi:dihydrofolate reductase
MAKRAAAARVEQTGQTVPTGQQVEVVYSAGVSLDGFIAAEDGGVDWLHAAMVKGESYGLGEFQASIDGVLMGRGTYEKALELGGFTRSSKPCWVFSKTLPASEPKKGPRITAAAPKDIVAALPAHGVTRAWLMGGGLLAASFLDEGLIDEVALGVMPVLLGSGIPLFGPLRSPASLELVESKTYKGGALGLRYRAVRRR